MKTKKYIILFNLILSLLAAKNSISQNTSATDSLKLLLEKSSAIEKANLLKQIGDNYQQTEYHQKAIIHYKKALKIYSESKDTLLQASVLSEIGAAYFYLFNFDKSLKYYLKALKIYEQINNQNGILKALNGISNIYMRYYNKEKALEYYLKSYEISEQTGNKKGLYNVLNNIGILYSSDMKTYDKALEYFRKSLLLIKESNDSFKMSTPIHNIAIVHNKMHNYDTALYYYFKALKLNQELQQNSKIALVTSNIAILYAEINDLGSAKKYLDRSHKISIEIGAKGIIENNYYNYTLLYALKGDLINMNKYSDLYIAIKDSIINEQSIHQIAEMQTKYETEKKEQQIEMLNIENKLKKTQLQTRTYWLLIFIIAFAIVVIFVMIFFLQKRRLLFANRNLVIKNLEIVASEKKLIDGNTKLHINVTGDENIEIKYTGSTLTDKQKNNIKSLIINYMDNNKNYLNIDFTENTLAKDLNVNRSYLSQVINELYNKNFTTFLNEYRIKEARKIMSAPQNLKYTIEYIAELVGYKSKTTFNNSFKKHVGVTPSFYLKTIQREVLSEKIE